MPTHLLIDHVTHGHPDLHACPLDVVEVEVMEHHEAQGAKRQARCIAQTFVQSIHVIRIVTFKVSDHLPQENGLDHFYNFLDERKDELNHVEDHQTLITLYFTQCDVIFCVSGLYSMYLRYVNIKCSFPNLHLLQ